MQSREGSGSTQENVWFEPGKLTSLKIKGLTLPEACGVRSSTGYRCLLSTTINPISWPYSSWLEFQEGGGSSKCPCLDVPWTQCIANKQERKDWISRGTNSQEPCLESSPPGSLSSLIYRLFAESTWIKGGTGSLLNNMCFTLAHMSPVTIDFLLCSILGPLSHIRLHNHSWCQLGKHDWPTDLLPASLNSHALWGWNPGGCFELYPGDSITHCLLGTKVKEGRTSLLCHRRHHIFHSDCADINFRTPRFEIKIVPIKWLRNDTNWLIRLA